MSRLVKITLWMSGLMLLIFLIRMPIQVNEEQFVMGFALSLKAAKSSLWTRAMADQTEERLARTERWRRILPLMYPLSCGIFCSKLEQRYT